MSRDGLKYFIRMRDDLTQYIYSVSDYCSTLVKRYAAHTERNIVDFFVSEIIINTEFVVLCVKPIVV